MPTPFMHLAFAQGTLTDPSLAPWNALIREQWGPFLLGNIAPDARISSGIRRADTHFFEYEPVIPVSAMQAMLTQYPVLASSQIEDDARRAFLAGYVAHLAMDEVWCTDVLFPYFTNLWDGNFTSFQMLHMILAWMDEQDYRRLPAAEQYPALATAQPEAWLPFVPDKALIDWRDLVAEQLSPGGHSRTTEILGQRIRMNAAEMDEFIHSEQAMNDYLWRNVPRSAVAAAEHAMTDRARSYIRGYLNGSATANLSS